jgi:hypothetical protein
MSEGGLSPRVQSDDGVRGDTFFGERWIGGARVDNVIGVLRGRNPALPALMLMAHHDTVPGSPGAADDTAGVASALEVIRALQAGGPPLRDVMIVITDGEEAGLLGAQAFFADDPAARRVGFVINMEARGGGGRAQMFETGPDNGATIDQFLTSAKGAQANSLSGFIYKQLPNDTDYTVAKELGHVPGLNLAFIGRQFDYHSPSSTVAALDQGAVQSLGDQVLGPARALADAPALPARTEDAVYDNLAGDFVVAYPPWAGWILIAGAAALLAWAIVRGRRAKDLPWLDLLQGFGAALLLIAASALALHAIRHLTGVGVGWIEGRPLLARFPAYEAAMALAGLSAAMLTLFALSMGEARLGAVLTALAAALAAQAFGLDTVALWEGVAVIVLALILTGRPLGFSGAWIGGLLFAFLPALLLQILAPTTAFVIAWPLLAALVVLHLVALNKQVPPPARWSVALALMALAGAWAGGLFHPLLQAMDVPELAALPLWLAALTLWPLLWPTPGSRAAHIGLATLTLAAGAGVALWLAFTSPWTVRHPNVVEPLYVVDGGHAWRVSPFRPDAWTQAILRADGGKIGLVNFPTFSHSAWAAPAAPVAAAQPTIDIARAADGAIQIKAAAPPGAMLHLDLKTDAIVTGGTADGRPMAMLTEPGKWTHFAWQSGDPLAIAFKPVGRGAVDIRYAAWSPGWPATAKPLPALPPRTMAWDMAGSTVAAGAIRSAW